MPAEVRVKPAPATAAETRQPNADILRIRAEARELLLNGNVVKARETLMTAINVDPDDHSVRLMLGLVQCRAGRFDDATYLLAELIAEDPNNAVAHVVLGTAYFGLGRLEDAEQLMIKALKLDDSLHEAHYNMAQIILTTRPKDVDAARSHYKKAIELGGDKDEKLEKLFE